jgi:membrane-associated protease RseP (regulator of RpoE activity)
MEDATSERNIETKRIRLQIALFVATFLTTTIAGANLCYSRDLLILKYGTFPWFGLNENFTLDDFRLGLNFSIPLLFILSVHEFGHYFTARYHRVKVSLPYYIPLPLFNIIPNFGTFGAVIRLRSRVESNIKHFDIGLAGPLAGFIATLIVLGYGFATLPPPEYIFEFHPDYKVFGLAYADQVYTEEYLREASRGGGVLMFVLGDNLLFNFMADLIADPARVPNPYEIIHYPFLVVGFIALFFTTLNLLPIGQLDGGHVIYGLFGRKKHSIIATTAFLGLVFYSGLGIANFHTDSRDDLVQIFLLIFFFTWLSPTF